MKKMLSLLAAALLFVNMGAQQLNESFEDSQFAPEGWTTIDSDSYCKWKRANKDDNAQLNVFDGRACAFVQGCYLTENYLITPQLRPVAGEKLHFAARVGDYASKGKLIIEVSTNGPEAASFVEVASYSTSSSAENHLWKTDWKEYNIDLSDFVGQRIFIAFHQSGEAEKIYIDAVSGVTLAGDAACEAPVNVKIDKLIAGGAVFSWEGEAAAYQYVCLLADQELDWTNAQTTTETTATVSGLYEATQYNFYVRAYCSETEQSLAPVLTFTSICYPEPIPFVETFYHHTTGQIAPQCWTVSSEKPQVWVVATKTYDDEGEGTLVRGSEHLYASGGGPSTVQVFAMPVVDATLNTLEVAFDYKNSIVNDAYGVLEVGYMTDPSNRNTFVSLKTLPQVDEYTHEICDLSAVPENIQFIAFRFAGGSSDFAGVSMDDFVVAPIGHSDEFKPESTIDDAEAYLLDQNYCEAQISWFAYNAEAFAIGLFSVDAQALIAGIVATTEECDLFAYYDEVAFSEYEDPDNHYYCSTKWILNADESGVQKGDAWDACVINIGTTVAPTIGLKPGKYQVQIYPYSSTTGMGTKIGTVEFELTEKIVSNLQVAVAEDNTTATLTWDTPELKTGERLYVSVRAGEKVAFDNFNAPADEVTTSPLTVEVEEGLTYSASVQILDRNKNPLGSEVTEYFTVGQNTYEPTNLTAEVFDGDKVTLSWQVAAQADRYELVLFKGGLLFSSLTINGTTRTLTIPEDGTYDWTIQAFNQGTTGGYFEVSQPIAGPQFTTKAAELPADAIEQDVWYMEAAPLDIPETDEYYRPGYYAWLIVFATGSENSAGRPSPWFVIYSKKEFAISGNYATSLGNVAMGEQITFMDHDGTSAGLVTATNAELRLSFQGFDEDYFDQGYRYAYYSGQYLFTGEDGVTYVARFFNQFCESQSYESLIGAAAKDHVGMWDEDPDFQSIEQVAQTKADGQKFIHAGQLFIIRDGRIYNAQGTLLK